MNEVKYGKYGVGVSMYVSPIYGFKIYEERQ